MYLLLAPSTRLLLPAPAQRFALPRVASRKVRVFSFGGGVQSHAVLVMQAMGSLAQPYEYFIFAEVGADSESADTLAYIEQFTIPYCKHHDIPFLRVQKQVGRRKADKRPDTLLAYTLRARTSIPLPMRMGHNGAPGNRTCTELFKIREINRACKVMGFTDVFCGLGISMDEIGRARDQYWHTEAFVNKKREYPLIDARMNRQACLTMVASAGLPEPPKSSCWFCPYRGREYWQTLRREQPIIFWRACILEVIENRRRALLGKDPVYFHPDCVPLWLAVGEQSLLFTPSMMDACEIGYCMV